MRQLKNTYYIIINGHTGIGKDTFIEYCFNCVPCNNISTVDSLRDLANAVFFYDGSELNIRCKYYRQFMHDLKTMVKKYNPNYFKYYVNDRLKSNHLNFIHVREEKEFKDYGKCIKVLLINPNMKLNDEELCTIDKSNNFNCDNYDHIIINEGTLKELEEKAKVFTDMFT